MDCWNTIAAPIKNGKNLYNPGLGGVLHSYGSIHPVDEGCLRKPLKSLAVGRGKLRLGCSLLAAPQKIETALMQGSKLPSGTWLALSGLLESSNKSIYGLKKACVRPDSLLQTGNSECALGRSALWSQTRHLHKPQSSLA